MLIPFATRLVKIPKIYRYARRVLEALAEELRTRGEIDLSECFIDGTFIVAKKRGRRVGATKRGKGTKLMVVADFHGLPLAADAASARPHEVTLVHALFRRVSLMSGREGS